MKLILVVIAFIAVVNVQGQGGPSPSAIPTASGPQGTPVTVRQQELEAARPSAMPSASSPMKPSPVVTIPSQPSISPPRPKGCSPGCGPNEICAELGLSYCRPGQSCSVCIKMTSIRFPASAIYSMIQPPKVPEVPPVPQVSFPSAIIPSTSTSQNSNLFTVTSQTQQAQPEPSPSLNMFDVQPHQQSRGLTSSIYDPLPPQNNNLDFFGFPVMNQQSPSSNAFGSMFPLLWMGDFGMGF